MAHINSWSKCSLQNWFTPQNWWNSTKITAARRKVQSASVVSPECLEPRALPSGSSLAAGRWTINADVDPANPSETIIVEQSPTDSSQIQVTINGKVFAEASARRIRSITVNAGAGDDTVQVNLPSSFDRIAIFLNGGDGNDTLEAGTGRAVIHGGNGDDVLTGSMGKDRLYGDDGDDILNGLAGNDILDGGNGSDTLRGGSGVNKMTGGRGRDWMYYSPGVDRLFKDTSDQVLSNSADVQHFNSDADFQSWLEHAASQNIRLNLGGLGGGIETSMADSGGKLTTPTSAPGVSNAQGAPSAGTTDFSTTNTQVSGVDEEDIIKTDGNYIYTIHENELVIVDVTLPSDANIVSRTQLPGWGSEMYLDGDRLTVISSVNTWGGPYYPLDDRVAVATPGIAMFRPIFWNWKPKSEVVTYDISDRAKPSVVEDTTVDGSVTASRSVDGRIYLVLNNYLSIPQPEWNYVPAANPDDYGTWVQESMDSYEARLAKFDFNSIIPGYTTKSFDASGVETDTSGKLLNGTDVWTPSDPLTNNDILTVAMINIHDGTAGVDSTTSIVGVNGEVYASTDALYVAAQDWSSVVWDGTGNQSAKTDIYKFDLTTDGSTYAASGVVDGTIIDQFAMDESGGYFHIATTSSIWQNQQSNNVFVLQQEGDKLATVSSLTGLSPTERIQSARFIGSELYLSTFRNVDPLLSIDLSDPLNPVLAGKLEVPGFSSYLQAWGDHDLVSIGQDADPTTGVVTGMQLSLFDISDPQNPTLVGTYKIGIKAWDSYSEALWDHHAFSLFDKQGILAIPVSHWDDTNGYSSDLDVFQLDASSGFTLLGQVNHDSEVERSLMLGDDLVSMSYNTLKINGLLDPSQSVAVVDLTNPNPPDPTPIPVDIPPIVIDPPVIDPTGDDTTGSDNSGDDSSATGDKSPSA